MIDKLIDSLASSAPIATMFRATLAQVLSDEALNKIFREHCQVQVESDVLFSHLFEFVSQVVSGRAASINSAFQASDKSYSRQALYDKLKGVESEVSSALLRVTSKQLSALYNKSKLALEDPIKGFHTYVIDGKTYDATEHRLAESRRDARAPMPGRAIAIFDTRTGMIDDLECDENAYRCERKIAEPLLERHIKRGSLYIADRNFSDGNLLSLFLKHSAYFLIRQHGACPSWQPIAGAKRVLVGKDPEGRCVYEQAIEVRMADGSYKTTRRVTLALSEPTAKGETEIHFLTNLPKRVNAITVASAYTNRWSIEICFGHLATAFNAEIRTLCYPKAAGLCFAVGSLLYNIMNLIRLLVLEHGQPSVRYKVTNLSYYYMADEIRRSQFAIDELISDSKWRLFAKMSTVQFVKFLVETAKKADQAKYRTHTRGPKKPRPKRKFTGTRHIATAKLLESRK